MCGRTAITVLLSLQGSIKKSLCTILCADILQAVSKGLSRSRHTKLEKTATNQEICRRKRALLCTASEVFQLPNDHCK